MARKRPRDAAESGKAILEAAQRVFAARGFHGARVEEIADRAGVAKGTVFLHFRDKENLLLALVRDRARAFIEIHAAMGGREVPPRRRLENLIVVLGRLSDDLVNFRRTVMGMWPTLPSGLRRRLLGFIRQGHQDFRDRVAGIFREFLGAPAVAGVSADTIAMAFLSALDGMSMRSRMLEVPLDGRDSAGALRMIFLDNLERLAADERRGARGPGRKRRP